MSNSIVITVPHRTAGAMWVFVGCQARPLWQLVELRCRTGIADKRSAHVNDARALPRRLNVRRCDDWNALSTRMHRGRFFNI
jgi:hypothetical protein